MERCPTQAVLPLVGLAAEKVIRDRYSYLSQISWSRRTDTGRLPPAHAIFAEAYYGTPPNLRDAITKRPSLAGPSRRQGLPGPCAASSSKSSQFCPSTIKGVTEHTTRAAFVTVAPQRYAGPSRRAFRATNLYRYLVHSI
ncbi:MAG: hypothetical protein ACQESR_08855 [Planctomycetota bacterium]